MNAAQRAFLREFFHKYVETGPAVDATVVRRDLERHPARQLVAALPLSMGYEPPREVADVQAHILHHARGLLRGQQVRGPEALALALVALHEPVRTVALIALLRTWAPECGHEGEPEHLAVAALERLLVAHRVKSGPEGWLYVPA